ncbi:Pre-mRNA-splicing factor SPP2 [Erysiphe necator]|uniref:Pre-mRNA-splicing factor n=1 Tax=Uncinula necator TaxID=52586 RepID=A0A0B1NZJ0_UNCNE|nr:Pre-mRNA-splicing factor SPP2 [Erysiphe necator]KHJ30455.1 putative pre-mrna-splicing factor spp2 [Erysiphe necator]
MPAPQDSPGLKSSNSKIGLKSFSLASKPSQQKSFHLKNSPFEKRSQSLFLNQEDSDLQTDLGHRFSVEDVTGFGEDGAFKDEDQTKGLLVIKRLKNKDWKSELRRRRKANDLLHQERRAETICTNSGGTKINETQKIEGVNVINSDDSNIEWGLSFRKRSGIDQNTQMKETEETENYKKNMQEDILNSRPEPQDLDEEALQALVGSNKQCEMSHLIISAQNTPSRLEVISEQEAYKLAIASAPEPSTLEDYERVPVEEFGSALLRGMGWNGEKVGGIKKVKPRQNLLGLGAKELKDAEELGAWVNKSDTKRLNSSRGGDRSDKSHGRLKPADYKREEEKRRKKRDERGGGSYRK